MTRSGADSLMDQANRKGWKNYLIINQSNGDIVRWRYQDEEQKNIMVRYYNKSKRMAPNSFNY